MSKSNLYATFDATDTYVFINRIWIKSFLVCPGSGAVAPFGVSIAISGNTNYGATPAGLVNPGAVQQPKDYINIILGPQGVPVYYPVNIRNVGNLILEGTDPFTVVVEYEFEKN